MLRCFVLSSTDLPAPHEQLLGAGHCAGRGHGLPVWRDRSLSAGMAYMFRRVCVWVLAIIHVAYVADPLHESSVWVLTAPAGLAWPTCSTWCNDGCCSFNVADLTCMVCQLDASVLTSMLGEGMTDQPPRAARCVCGPSTMLQARPACSASWASGC